MKIYLGPFPENPNQEREKEISIDDYDLWNLDNTLALVISEALKAFINMDINGIPGEFSAVGGDDSYKQYSFDFYQESHEDALNQGFQNWINTLKEMQWAFSEYNRDWEDDYCSGVIDHVYVDVDLESKFKRIEKGPNHTFQIDWKGRENHWNKIRNGMELFIKHFSNLWD